MRFFDVTRRAAVGLLWAALASQAAAVVISTTGDAPNLVAPGNDPGWNNVGRTAGGSGVYLGNRWVITANHVSSGAFRLTDGRVFNVSVGSEVQLQNPNPLFGTPDLRMFRLAADPGLPALTIAQAAPGVGQQLTMIGAGVDRAAQQIGWQTFVTSAGLQWNSVPLPAANQYGYNLGTTSEMRWGLNAVISEPQLTNGTITFATRWDFSGLPFEAQATQGDSGGGVFHNVNGGWELAGLMTATSNFNNQPSGTVVFGDETVIASLASYRANILSLVDRAEPLWQNQVNHFDVSGTGGVSPRDALLLINELLTTGAHALPGGPSGTFFDVNGDYNLTTGDVLAVINHLLGEESLLATASSGTFSFVPEPSSMALAIGGLLPALLLAGRVARRRMVRRMRPLR